MHFFKSVCILILTKTHQIVEKMNFAEIKEIFLQLYDGEKYDTKVYGETYGAIEFALNEVKTATNSAEITIGNNVFIVCDNNKTALYTKLCCMSCKYFSIIFYFFDSKLFYFLCFINFLQQNEQRSNK